MDNNGLPNSIFAKTEYQWLNVRGSDYYCDICESLKKVDEEKEKEREELPSDIAQQLKGDCRLDILSETEDDQSGIKIAMSALQQVGYTKIRLAFKATSEIERKKAIKEAQIERNSLRDFEQRIKNLDSIPSNEVRNWYIEQQKNIWHKNDYLPWLLYENEFACIRLTFDVCERQPQQRWEGGYTCV
uniref:DUF7753 domain-containing protein n=1 Tax=Meloidogyne hapla TaxID=6305 RepID=A0A1I8C376_MELHA